MTDLTGFRVVAVHAHPDDEVLFTGGTLADLARRGATVTLLTLTLGDEGEVIGEPYQSVVDNGVLAGLRVRELEDAVVALGIEHEFVGGAGFFRDSGMEGSPAHEHPRALVNRVEEAAGYLRGRFAELDPHIIVTYGPDGGYGHPDHIAVHKAVHTAAGDRRVWWAVFDRAENYAGLDTLTAPEGWQKPDRDYLDNFTNEASEAETFVRYSLDDAAYAAKRAGMAAHPTQIWLADGTVSRTNPVSAFAGIGDPAVAPVAFGLSNLLVMPLLRAEFYHLGQAGTAAAAPAEGAAGLFAGLER
ncbi:PIG-L family deacetylase [Corynebacterium phoceense]|uniref:PIG-L family deacetylase n=1 Tax=Corynebacterium phoceense TaxID=1686286 RepID=UPI00211BEA26|nr:PIG-L family deacetylase [Corynebacterium phoceense]MCQ9340091.1 PIG-L family deacetylase [Corynebacterium phoceense]